jgi:gas vesicle protein
MEKAILTLPELAMIAGTRGALGAGAALLLADRLNKEQRKTAGWTLLLVGVLSTVPLALLVLVRFKSEGDGA